MCQYTVKVAIPSGLADLFFGGAPGSQLVELGTLVHVSLRYGLEVT